jgi:hypothetical protein
VQRFRGSWLTLLLLIAQPASAAEWFVALDGDDDHGDGSIEKPYRSVGRVLSTSIGVVKPGDTVTLRGSGEGRYEECQLRLRMPLTLRSAPGERAHVHCDPSRPDTSVVQIDPEGSGSRVIGLELSGAQYYGVFLQSWWDRVGQADGQGASDVLLEDLHIHHTGRDGIKLTPKSNRVTIRGCHIHHTGALYPPGTPLERRNADGIDNVGAHQMRVEGCHIHDTATSGLYFKGGARDAYIVGNRIENVGMSGILVGFDTSEQYFDTAENPDYFESINARVQDNLVRGAAYAGIGLYASSGAVVRNNSLIDTAREGHAALYFGVAFQDWEAAAKRPPNRGALIERNLVLQSDRPCVVIRWSHELDGLSGLSGPTGMDYNLFHDRQGACRFSDNRPTRKLVAAAGLERWQAHSEGDAGSLETAFEPDAAGVLPKDSALGDRFGVSRSGAYAR